MCHDNVRACRKTTTRYTEAQGVSRNVHELGVVHYDLREDNFLVDELDGISRLWLIDFGNGFLSEDELKTWANRSSSSSWSSLSSGGISVPKVDESRNLPEIVQLTTEEVVLT